MTVIQILILVGPRKEMLEDREDFSGIHHASCPPKEQELFARSDTLSAYYYVLLRQGTYVQRTFNNILYLI
jgi:hypothetical protein